MWDAAARVARSAAKKFSCIERSKSSSLTLRKPPRRSRTPPTLLTSTSTLPCRSSAAPTRRSGPPGSTRSASTAETRSRPASVSTVRAPAMTSAPSAARLRTTANPIPLLAPVTTATLSSSSRSTTSSSGPGACARPRGAENTPEPAVDPGRDILPVGRDHVEVRTSLEVEVVGLCRGALVALVLRVGQRCRHGVVLGSADEQQRCPVAVLEVNLGRRVQMEVRKPALVEDLSALGNRVALVGGSRVLRRECVHERVRELLGRERHDTMPLRRMSESGRRRLQCREREHEDPLGRGRAHRDTGPPEAAVEEQLHEQPAVGMPDQHRRLIEFANQTLVVIDDLGDAEARRLLRAVTDLRDVAVLARPLRCGHREAAPSEVLEVVLPAARGEPGTVDEHQ